MEPREYDSLALEVALAALEGAMKACAVPDCGRAHVAKGYCNAHYRQMQRTGTVHEIAPPHGGKYGPAEEPTVRLAGLRISRHAAEVLERRGPSLYAAAKATIEEAVR